MATCVKLECVKTVKNKNVANISRHLGSERRDFFRKPPAFHRLLFMPPFAGYIGARAGSLKLIAQIPRKAHRWSLRGDLKNGFLALNRKLKRSKNSFLCPHKTRTARGAAEDRETEKTALKKEVVQVWYSILLICAPEFFHSMGVMSTKKLRIRLLSISHRP